MQPLSGNPISLPFSPASEPAVASQVTSGEKFASVFALEMQQTSVSADADVRFDEDSQLGVDTDTATLPPLVENLSESGFMDEVWAVLEEVLPLQDLAAGSGTPLPQALAGKIGDAVFELVRVVDELSAALAERQLNDARLLSDQSLQGDTMAVGSKERSGLAALSSTMQDLARLAQSLSQLNTELTSMLPDDTAEPLSAQPAVADALSRLRSLLETKVLDPFGKPLPASHDDLSMERAIPEPSIVRAAASVHEPVFPDQISQARRVSGDELLQILSSAPTVITELPAAMLSTMKRPAAGDVLDSTGPVIGVDTRMNGWNLDQAVNGQAGVDSLLDAGFALKDGGVTGIRELVSASLASLDVQVRSASAGEIRSAGMETGAPLPAAADKPVLTENRTVLATAKLDVWLQSSEDLPEHILQHVGRMHAQSLRLHGAGATDLVQRLTLSLHPDDLGQVDVQMRTGDQIGLVFHAREGATRELLEQNIGRLRQLFEEQGISLGDVSIGSGSAADRQRRDEPSDGLSRRFGDPAAQMTSDHPSPSPRIAQSDRLIDIRA